ncbi:tail fiber assembly protein [Enterobacter roggenkampii]|uniref:tail fiber assembly protein n=1 Tax=Enterobacter roggenkampii TaxID=1812935 RepID=UPI003D7C6A24
MNTYLYDARTNAFYPLILQADYEASGTWPENGVGVDDATFALFQNPPAGKMRAPDSNGNPSWVDIPPPANSELRKSLLTSLSNTYQDDIEKLNRAWLAAAVNDGVNETAKKDVVLGQINTRKTQYASDRAAIIAQYPD